MAANDNWRPGALITNGISANTTLSSTSTYIPTTSTYIPTTSAGTYYLQPGTSLVPYVVTTGGATWPSPEPAKRSALDWLDSEVEDTCKIARAA